MGRSQRLCAYGLGVWGRYVFLAWFVLLGLPLLGVLTSERALAQVTPPAPLPPLQLPEPTFRSGEPPPLQKEEPLKPEPAPLPTPPPSSLEEPVRGPVIRVVLREIRTTGNTVFTDAELATVTAPYLNRELTTEDLESVRLALTLYYVKNGYVTSGAIIPDQPVKEGVITIEIIEGALTQIDIEGTEHFLPYYFRSRLALAAGPPVNITTIQERLQLFQQDARLQRINAELRPGVKRGESELNVKVTERSPYRLWAEYNNFQTPTVGENRGLGTFSHENLFGLGDPFRFTYARSEGVDPLIDTSYALPLTPYDTILTSSFRLNDFTVVEEPFDFLDIESQTQVIGFTLRHPVIRSLNQELGLALTGEWEYNKTQSKFLVSVRDQGIPVNPNLIPGSTDTGVNIVSALRFTPDWIYRTQDAVLALRSRFSFGLDVLDATVNSGVDANGFQIPDAQFFSWLGSVQAVKRFDNLAGIQLLGRFDMQLANDALFPLEQYPVGGRYTVRGYRENTFVRDNAIVTSVEARLPVWRYASGEDMFQLAPFFDYGSAWNNGDEPPLSGGGAADLGYLASVGIGLRWTVLPQNRAYYEIYWGHKINDIDQGSGTLQDEGIHMQFVLQIF